MPAFSSTACSEISRPPTWRTSPNGIVAKPDSAKKTDTTGATRKSTRSARAGMKSSLVSILSASASGWKSPNSRRPRIEARLAPDAVLHDGGLLALDPGQEPAQVQHEAHDEGDPREGDAEVDHDRAHGATRVPRRH